MSVRVFCLSVPSIRVCIPVPQCVGLCVCVCVPTSLFVLCMYLSQCVCVCVCLFMCIYERTIMQSTCIVGERVNQKAN